LLPHSPPFGCSTAARRLNIDVSTRPYWQKSRDEYCKLKKVNKFVNTYKRSLKTANDTFKGRFVKAFDDFGMGKNNPTAQINK